MSATVNLFGPTELAQTQETIGTTYLGQTRTELLKQILVAVSNRTGGGSGGAITGEGKLWFTDTAPDGWMICDGAEVSRATYADLFAVIGTTYGIGNGTTTFNIPDFRGRTPVGKWATSVFDPLGAGRGSEDASLGAANLPPLDISVDGISAGGPNNFVTGVSYDTGSTGTAFSIIQPSRVVNFIIKT